MADNTPTTAADMPNRAQQNSPFMKLPTELRLRIYEFALDDIVDDIESDVAHRKQVEEQMIIPWPSPSKAEHQIFVGVLSLLHTSRDLRRECLDAVLAPAEAFKSTSADRHKALAEAFRKPHMDDDGNLMNFETFVRVQRSRRLESRENMHRYRRMTFICDAIALVAWDATSSSRCELVRYKQHRLD
jgi:hypothetical protein